MYHDQQSMYLLARWMERWIRNTLFDPFLFDLQSANPTKTLIKVIRRQKTSNVLSVSHVKQIPTNVTFNTFLILHKRFEINEKYYLISLKESDKSMIFYMNTNISEDTNTIWKI